RGGELSQPVLEFDLAGYVQEDFRSFHDYADAKGQLPALGADNELRRLRLCADAKWKRLSVEFDFDPHDDTEHLKNLFADLKITRGLHLTAGNMKVPVSPEWLTSAAKTDFVERNLIADALAPGRDWGVKVGGDGRHVAYH